MPISRSVLISIFFLENLFFFLNFWVNISNISIEKQLNLKGSSNFFKDGQKFQNSLKTAF